MSDTIIILINTMPPGEKIFVLHIAGISNIGRENRLSTTCEDLKDVIMCGIDDDPG